MLSGGKAGLISGDVLRKEQEENRRKEKRNQPLEGSSCFLNPLTHFKSVTTFTGNVSSPSYALAASTFNLLYSHYLFTGLH